MKWLTEQQAKFGNTDQEEVTSDQKQCFMSLLTKTKDLKSPIISCGQRYFISPPVTLLLSITMTINETPGTNLDSSGTLGLGYEVLCSMSLLKTLEKNI